MASRKLKKGDLALDSAEMWGVHQQWIVRITEVLKDGSILASPVCWGPGRNFELLEPARITNKVLSYEAADLMRVENPELITFVSSLG